MPMLPMKLVSEWAHFSVQEPGFFLLCAGCLQPGNAFHCPGVRGASQDPLPLLGGNPILIHPAHPLWHLTTGDRKATRKAAAAWLQLRGLGEIGAWGPRTQGLQGDWRG